MDIITYKDHTGNSHVTLYEYTVHYTNGTRNVTSLEAFLTPAPGPE